MFTARYARSSDIKEIKFVFKWLNVPLTYFCLFIEGIFKLPSFLCS